ncbi:MAG: 4Fe-4S binding protein [Phycisphaerales bacterium]
MTPEPNISRRSFLRGRLLGSVVKGIGDTLADALPALRTDESPESSSYAHLFPILRPPRAVPEPQFLAECTRCDACLEACPHDAIIHAPPRFRQAAGTPMIDPHRQPCWMCHDTPCVSACEPGVLDPNRPIRMGTARINTTTCLAHQGSFCTVCSEQCPVEDAIELTSGKPHINEDKCTGCGVCAHVCPAPDNAVLLIPAASTESQSTAPPQRATPAPDRSRPTAPWEQDMNRVSDPFAPTPPPKPPTPRQPDP